MKHSTRKILTLLLALIMLLSMVPLSAYAVGTEGKEQAAARGEAEEISARGTGGVLNASGETKSSAAFGGKKAGSVIVGVPRRDGSSAYTVTFQMRNLVGGSMFVCDPVLPDRLDVDLSAYADWPTFRVADIQNAIQASLSSSVCYPYPGLTEDIPFETPRALSLCLGTTVLWGSVTSFRFEEGQLQYKLYEGEWTTVPANETLAVLFIPFFKYVKFDPNSADQSIDTEGIFRGAYTNVGGAIKEGEQYILCRLDELNTISAQESYNYSILDPNDWPGTPHLINAPETVSFLVWAQKGKNNSGIVGEFPDFHTLPYDNSAYRIENADTVIRVFRTHNIDGTNTDYPDYKPLVNAIYEFWSKADSTNVQPLYSDERDNWPSQGGLPAGSVQGSKDAEWVNKTAGIGKITLTLSSVPLHTGADVIFIMDYSGSMSPRYSYTHKVEREAPMKLAVWNAVNSLIRNGSLNNRAALVAFSGASPTISKYFKTSNEIESLHDMLQGIETYGRATHYDKALTAAKNILAARSAAGTEPSESQRPAYVIFITDGEPNGDNSQIAPLSKELRNTYGATVYAIGIQTSDSGAASWLNTIAGAASRVTEIDTPEELDPLIASLVDTIAGAATDAVFTDTISEYFDAFTAEELAAYNAEHNTSYAHSPEVTVDADHKTVTVDVGAITGTPDNPQTFEIYIKIEPDHVGDVNGADPAQEQQKTNSNIVLDYVDHTGAAKQIPKEEIGDPFLGRFKNAVQIKYTLVDENGSYIDENGNPTSTPVQIGATLDRTGLDLIDEATRNYTVYADVNPNDPSVTIDQSAVLGKLWGVLPTGYLLYGESSQTATITTDNTVVPVVEFKLYIPLVDVSVTKVWDDADDQDGIRPASVTIKLKANGTELAGKSVTLPIAGSSDPWSYTWEGLPKYPAGTITNPIAYTVAEDPVPTDYTAAVTGDMSAGFTVTNKHTPTNIDIKVTKVWKDNNSSKRPDSVTITLLADGEDTGKSLVLTEESGWTHTWTNLDKYKAGRKIVYTVSEKQISGYRKPVISGSAASGFTVTNTMRPPQSPFTGDTRAWLPWLGAFLLSGFGLAGDAIVRKRKRKRKEEE